MDKTLAPTTGTARLEVVDALRGFALMAIVLLHSMEHYNLFFTPTWQPQWLTAFDGYFASFMWFLLAGKAYATFSLLFGFSFYIQLRSARRRGEDFRLRFAWRLLLLAGFAQLHALFYNGDILLFYAFCGLILIPAASWSNRTILIVAAVLLLQPVDWIHMALAQIAPGYVDTSSRFIQYAAQAEIVGRDGNLWQTLADNIGNGQLYSNFWQVEAGRICQTPALFLLGMWLGRKEMFIRSRASERFWRRVLACALVAVVLLQWVKDAIAPGLENATWQSHFGIATGLPGNFALMASLVALFVLCWFRAGDHGYRFQRLSIRYGRMSLTNYITQSIIGVTLFYNFGFGLFRYCGPALSAAIGLCIILVQVVWSRAWLSTHRQGPLEALWKKLTWLRSSRSTPCPIP